MADTQIQVELLKRFNQLSEEEQRQVLRFAENLPVSSPQRPERHFLDLAGTLDSQSAQEMLQAIEEDCERIDPHEW
jgi:hypothetical protein